RSSLNWLQEAALLAHVLPGTGLQQIYLSARMRWHTVRAKRRVGRFRDERLDWPDPEPTHTRLHHTIYSRRAGYRVAVMNLGRMGAVQCISWNICFWSASSPPEHTCCPG